MRPSRRRGELGSVAHNALIIHGHRPHGRAFGWFADNELAAIPPRLRQLERHTIVSVDFAPYFHRLRSVLALIAHSFRN